MAEKYFTSVNLNGEVLEVKDKNALTEHQDLTAYAKKTDIPDVTGYAKKTDIPDTTNFAKKTDIVSVEYVADSATLKITTPTA